MSVFSWYYSPCQAFLHCHVSSMVSLAVLRLEMVVCSAQNELFGLPASVAGFEKNDSPREYFTVLSISDTFNCCLFSCHCTSHIK